ncbi:MAG: helix-turn-helix domain-containing protein [Nanoarchaeota archaeon]|nr:helix-turn-helix domain-containing protein [Nanoarchaeota archaeon]
MWVLKFSAEREGSIFAPRCKKFNVSLIGYPLTNYKKRNNYYFSAVGLIFGEEKNKQEFFKDIKKDKRIKKIESKGDFYTILYTRDKPLIKFYNPEFINIKPIIISNKGEEIWEIGSWEKKNLSELIKHLRKFSDFKIYKFKEEKISDFFFLNAIPNLTKKQKQALELAVTKGYYEYPKKIDLKSLAKLMKISYSTYQAHLRKAEKKIIPYFLSKI